MLVADDDAGIRKSVTRLLSSTCDVVGYATDIQALMDAATRLRPDIVLLDFSLSGDRTALDACRRLTSEMPNLHVVVFTAHDDAEIRRLAFDAGASGFVWKFQPGELLETIQSLVIRSE